MGSLRRTAAATLAVLALTAALAGCARDTVVDRVGVAAPQPEGTGDIDQALAAWRDFPVDRHPRPIVLIGPVAVRPAGYTTGDAKVAAVSGRYRIDVPLPPDPPPATVALPDGPATVPVIGAAAAVDLMKADAGESKGGENVPPLAIVGFEFGTEALPTDRGTVTLPVWRVHTADELGPTVVLAVADSALARPAASQSAAVGTVPPGSAKATVDATGTHLTLTVAEADPHCPGEAIYKREPVVRESGGAVAVGFTATQTGTVPGSGACALYLKLKQVTYRVDLAAPLGARVLVTALGEPAPVTG
jgi:hypothetical protein